MHFNAMKKLITFAVILIVSGYVIYQNGSLWILKFFSLTSGAARNTSPANSSTSPNPPYKDGTYTGDAANAFYGNLQIKAITQGSKLTDVQFLQYPNDRARSIVINTLAIPNLKQEAVQAQNASVNIVSGATDSSNAFIESLKTALSQAK